MKRKEHGLARLAELYGNLAALGVLPDIDSTKKQGDQI